MNNLFVIGKIVEIKNRVPDFSSCRNGTLVQARGEGFKELENERK